MPGGGIRASWTGGSSSTRAGGGGPEAGKETSSGTDTGVEGKRRLRLFFLSLLLLLLLPHLLVRSDWVVCSSPGVAHAVAFLQRQFDRQSWTGLRGMHDKGHGISDQHVAHRNFEAPHRQNVLRHTMLDVRTCCARSGSPAHVPAWQSVHSASPDVGELFWHRAKHVLIKCDNMFGSTCCVCLLVW